MQSQRILSMEKKNFRFNHVLESVQTELAHLSSGADPSLAHVTSLSSALCDQNYFRPWLHKKDSSALSS